MPLIETLLEKLSGHNAAPPVVDLDANRDRRLALLARARHMARAQPVVEPPEDGPETLARRFEIDMARRGALAGLGRNFESLQRVDEIIDLSRGGRGPGLSPTTEKRAAAWLGEVVRSELGFSWTEDDTLSDGRTSFDPREAIRVRIADPKAPRLIQAVAIADREADRLTMA